MEVVSRSKMVQFFLKLAQQERYKERNWNNCWFYTDWTVIRAWAGRESTPWDGVSVYQELPGGIRPSDRQTRIRKWQALFVVGGRRLVILSGWRRGECWRQVRTIPGKQYRNKCWRVGMKAEPIKQRGSGVKLHEDWLDRTGRSRCKLQLNATTLDVSKKQNCKFSWLPSP